MNVLVTGAKGFIGQNLIEQLKRLDNVSIFEFDKDDSFDMIENIISKTDFIFHLAGINRPQEVKEFYKVNSGLTADLINAIQKKNLRIPILITSSIQIEKDNDYGKSKLEAENILLKYNHDNSAPIYIYRLPNVFGKWSRPNYNTVIATWCYNIANGIDIMINDRTSELSLVYIDDVMAEFIKSLLSLKRDIKKTHYNIPTVYRITLGEIFDLLNKFYSNRETLIIPEVGAGFERALYATYLSFLPKNKFSYPLKKHIDERGSFFEILKTFSSGQFSISTSAAGITRGNHYHNTKNEKFLVIKGEAVIKFRHINESEVFEYRVSDKELNVVDIPVGYTHSITNTGGSEMMLVLWASELFQKDNPDTYYLEV